MSLNIGMPQPSDLSPRITVFGVGGAGGNGVNNMIDAGLEGVEFVVANTDAQALGQSLAQNHIQLGQDLTQGLGAGARPEVGAQAAVEAIDEINAHLDGSHMVFVTAGMGGGTGTGAAPIIAQAAKDRGILTIGVVTKPFAYEGKRRMESAESGISELQKYVDTLIVIPNQNLFRLANEQTTFADAFAMADNVLRSGVCGITDLMVMPGLINLDFADIKTVMAEMGKAMMGTGEEEGENRAIDAAESAISNPLLDDVSMQGARGVLINITGGMDMTLYEVDAAANRIREEVDPDANIIVGSTFNDAMEGRMRVSIVATGIEAELEAGLSQGQRPSLRVVAPQQQQQRPAATAAPAQRPAAQSGNQPAAPLVAPAATRPATEIKAEIDDDAFIAPEPARPNVGAAASGGAQMTHADPAPMQEPSLFGDLADAPVQEAAQQTAETAPTPQAPVAAEPVQQQVTTTPEPQRKPGLLERVAGFGLGRNKAERKEAVARREPVMNHAPAAPVAEPQVRVSGQQQAAVATAPAAAPEEQEDIELPAFLRRQSN
ncbi:MAG: cell division protein FtsZ [Alphaproteobacteria bacterium]